MAEELTIISRLQQASKTEAEWEQSNPVLKQGELAISIDKNKIKIGDGTTTWKKLPYYADEIAWDKVASKPTTIAGYGITDAKIANGAITLGGNTITPLTQHQDISGKVDKESGKGLSSNDYTTAEKNKLAGIASGATANQGTVTNIVAGNGLSGGPITTSGSISLKIALAGSLGGIVPMIGYESSMPLDPFPSDAIDSEVLADVAEKDTIALPLQVDSEGHAFIVIGEKVIEKLRELLGK